MTPGRREALILGGAGLAAAAAGFLAGPAVLKGFGGGEADSLWAANLKDLSGKPRTVGEWRGRVLVCNFWATWCAPCREEIPLLMEARERYRVTGMEFVGIAIDNAIKVVEYAASLKISYPILVAEANGLDLMRKLGNAGGGLPYTVIADRDGAVVHRKLGAVKGPELEALLKPLAKG
jgi:thiol-disulfide isomerase/thioredoxin